MKRYWRKGVSLYSTFYSSLILFFKGVAMGTADVIPGISGGTVALICGIYPRLVLSLEAFRLRHIAPILTLLFLFYIPSRRRRALAALQEINGSFLLTLLSGLLFAFMVMVHIIPYFLEHHAFFTFSLFFGLIAFSVTIPLRLVKGWGIKEILALLLCLAFMIYIATSVEQGAANPHPLAIFLSGAIAICAMILPGISGSYILVLLGQYHLIIEAFRDRELVIVLAFLLGILVGIFSFVRLLRLLLERWHNPTMAALTGLLAGSLWKIWPFSYLDLPLAAIGPSHWLQAALFALLGALIVLGLDSFSRGKIVNSPNKRQ